MLLFYLIVKQLQKQGPHTPAALIFTFKLICKCWQSQKKSTTASLSVDVLPFIKLKLDKC